MTDKYIPKIGDLVEIIVYEDCTVIGHIVEIRPDAIHVKAQDGEIYDSWDETCVRPLTPLEALL
jgi:hypothetical protein